MASSTGSDHNCGVATIVRPFHHREEMRSLRTAEGLKGFHFLAGCSAYGQDILFSAAKRDDVLHQVFGKGEDCPRSKRLEALAVSTPAS